MQERDLLDQVRGEAGSQVGNQKDRISSMAHSYAKELGSLASGSPQDGPVKDLVQDLSRRLGGAGHWIENHEPADVLDEVRWVPFVSFWQVSADLALAFSTEPGHGHNYTGEHVDGWAAILQPDGWTPERADELRDIALSGQMSQAFPAADG